MRAISFLIAGAMLCLTSSSIYAQLGKKKDGKSSHSKRGNTHIQDNAQAESRQLKQQFGLTDSQASQVFNVALEKERKLDALKHRKGLKKDAKISEKNTISTWYSGKLQEIMTETQYLEYKNTLQASQ